MKKIFFFLIFLHSSYTYSYDAIVIVLEAPLLKEKSLSSTVLQTLRKGSRVYVPNEIGNQNELDDFIQTYDRAGNIAYIPSKYIKIITNDERENLMPISLKNNDPTDYRLEEPIPKTYPFNDDKFIRSSIAFSAGNNIKAPYSYNSNYNKQTYSSEFGGRLYMTHRVKFDLTDRYYFGFLGAITTSSDIIQFANGDESKENRTVLRVGPIITFDAFRNSNYCLTLGTGFTYNYHRSSLELSNSSSSEQRVFTGYSLSPIASTLVQVLEIIPETDFIAGADISLFLPHSETSNHSAIDPQLWGAESPNQIHANLKAQVSFLLGLQAKY